MLVLCLGAYEVPRPTRASQPAGPKDGDDPKAPALAFHKVGRGDLVVTIEERGEIGSVNNTPIVCKVRNNERGTASTIKWLVDDGSAVKRGDKVAELDDTLLRDQVRTQETMVAEKRALLEKAVKDRDLAAEQGKLEVETAEDNIEIAAIEQKQAADGDRAKMEIRHRQARRAARMARILADTRKDKAEAALAPAKAALEAELAKLADLKDQLAACVLRAPRDGMVLYYVPERVRFGISGSVVAVGETVREGQVLMTIPDLQRLQVVAKVSEGLVARIRPSARMGKSAKPQRATVVADAFPGLKLLGDVLSVASQPSQADFFAADVKLFPTTIVIAPGQEVAGLKPGMTALVTIHVDERKDVLRISAQAVQGVRRNRVCYVKTADGVEPRRVDLGESNDVFVEVKDGLKEGEEVVLNPQALRPPRRAPAGGQGRLTPFGASHVLVRSVRPADDVGLARVERYGLTLADLNRIEETTPGLELVAPSRSFPTVVRSPLTGRTHQARIVATTAAYSEVHQLDGDPVDEGHRFLAETDQEAFNPVAVLGAEVARRLFPHDDPLGQAIVLFGRPFRVVGVVRERPAQAALNPPDHDVYIPLAMSRRLFGKTLTVRTAGRFRREEIELNEISVVLRQSDQAAVASAAIRGLLEHYHDRPDWQVIDTLR
jgi:multidrug efflux pump subunit AcrA (membrane-fusion protein)